MTERTPRVSDERGYDVESVALVDAMNMVPGIQTVESCCGHGEREFLIWFQTESLDDLPSLLYWFDSCHCGLRGWRVIAKTDCAMSPVTFMVEGPIGDYEGADKIASLIREDNSGIPEGES